jgi:hypothetical protein
MGERFLDMIARADPTKNYSADVLLDTNVALEIYSVGDLLRVGDECGTPQDALRSPRYKYRQLRGRHSTIVAWWLAKQRRAAGILGNEVVDQLDKVAPLVPPGMDGTSYVFTTAIIHVVMSFVVRGRIGALTNVNHLALGSDADNELLKQAIAKKIPLISNEGLPESGVPVDEGLRKKAKKAGVAVFTPEEYLENDGVDVTRECRKFVAAIPKALREARRVVDKSLAEHEVMDDLESLYRFVLLDEVDARYAHIPRPPLSAAPTK